MTRSLVEAAKAVDGRRARSRQRKVGASDAAGCRRRAGYVHHRHPVTDPENTTGLKAIAGTWFHAGALETMRRQWGALIEVGVETDTLRGRADAIHLPDDWREAAGLRAVPDSPDVVEVEDVKTRDDARAVDVVRIRGPRRSELYQVHLYADALRRGALGRIDGRERRDERSIRTALEARGTVELPVERVRLRYMARTGDESAEFPYEQPFDPDIAGEAWQWVEQIAASTSPDQLPRDHDGPGLAMACDYCPFVTACWGAAGDVKPQAQLIVTDADLAETLAEYDRQRALEAEAKAAKELARAKLDGTDAAIYVPTGEEGGFRLGWSGGRPVAATVEPDVDAMIALFEEGGVEVPMREVPATTTARSIRVVPWEHPDPACGKPVGDPVPWDDNLGTEWTQDRARGGWTGRSGPIDPDDHEELTAGQYAKRFPDYVDPRPRCVLKPKHSGDCLPPSGVIDLDVETVVDDLADTA